jgi:hypothetical protein
VRRGATDAAMCTSTEFLACPCLIDLGLHGRALGRTKRAAVAVGHGGGAAGSRVRRGGKEVGACDGREKPR